MTKETIVLLPHRRMLAAGLVPGSIYLPPPLSTALQTATVAIIAFGVIAIIAVVILSLVNRKLPRVHWGSFSLDFTGPGKSRERKE